MSIISDKEYGRRRRRGKVVVRHHILAFCVILNACAYDWLAWRIAPKLHFATGT